MSAIDDLFKGIEATKEFDAEVDPLDINDLFKGIDEAYPTQERLESQEFLKAAEEEAEFERQEIPSELETIAERGDIFAPQADPEVEIQEPLEFEPEAVTPSKDESTLLSQIGSGLADIKAGGFSLGEKVSIPTASGISEGDPQYREAVKAENTRGKDILTAIGKISNNVFSHDDFEFMGTVPTKQSLQPVEDALIKMGKDEAEVKADLDSVRSYIMRSEQFRRGMEKKHWNKVAESLYSTDEQIHNIYDRLNFVVNKLPSSGKADEEILKGFFEGTLEHDISSMIGWAAATNPQRAAKLAKQFEIVKREIDDNSIDHGKAVNFAKEVAKIIGPMSKTMAKGAVAGAVPGVGTMLAPTVMAPDWMSAEAGGIFEESVREGVAPEDAAGNAILFGIASGLVEQLQVGRFKDLVSTFGKDRFKNLLKEGVQKFIKKRGVKAAQKLASNFAVQTSQEGVQKAITTIAKETNVADAGLSEKDVGDILLDGWEGLKTEMIETAPHMAALTAISGLTGLSLGKARRIISPRVNRSIQDALGEQDLEYTPENIAQVLAEDPELQNRINENMTLRDMVDAGRNLSYAHEIEADKKVTPAEIQKYWKEKFNVPLTFETAKEKAEVMKVIQARREQEGINKELRDARLKRFDAQYNEAIKKAEEASNRLKTLREEMPLMLEDKRPAEIIEEEQVRNNLNALKDGIISNGDKITNYLVIIKHWREITGEKITRKEANNLITLIEELDSRDIQEDTAPVEEISQEDVIAPTREDTVVEDIAPPIEEAVEPIVEEVVPEEVVPEEVVPEEVVEPESEKASSPEVEQLFKEIEQDTPVEKGRAKVDNPWDYVDESKNLGLSLSSDYKDLSNKEKSLLIKKLKGDINTTIKEGFVDETGYIIIDDKSRVDLKSFFGKLTKEQNKISRDTKEEREIASAKNTVKREDKYIESREGLTKAGLSKETVILDDGIVDVLKSSELDSELITRGVNQSFDKDYSQKDIDSAISNVVNKETGGEIESDIRRLFVKAIDGVGYDQTDSLIKQIDFYFGDDHKKDSFTEEELEEAAGEDMFFSITKEGIVRPTKDELVLLERAGRDLEYFIPSELLKDIYVERVDNFFSDGEVIENANGSITKMEDGRLRVRVNKDSTVDELVETLYHEVMGHAGVANVINNNSKLYKEALRLFKSNEALPRVNELRSRYKTLIDKTRATHGQKAADDIVFTEWMAHEMHDYMLNRDEQSIGAKLWNLFKDWLIQKGWVEAKDADEFMRVLTKEMRKVPPSKISSDFHIKYQGPAVAYSLKDRVSGAKKRAEKIAKKKVEKKPTDKPGKTVKEFIKEAKKEVREKERAKRETAVKKEKVKKKEAVAKEKAKTAEVKEKAKVEKKETIQKQREDIKALKEKHKEELKELRRKINQQLKDSEVRIEEFHKTALEYARYAINNKNDLNEFKAFLLRMRPKTAKGVLGAKNKTVQKLKDLIEKRDMIEAKADLEKTIKKIPKEITIEEKKFLDKIISSFDMTDSDSKMEKSFSRLLKTVKKGVPKDLEDSVKAISSEIEAINKINFSKLNSNQIKSLSNLIKQLSHIFKERQKEFVSGVKRDYQELKENVVEEISQGKKEIEQSDDAIPSKAIAKQLNSLSKVNDFMFGNRALRPDVIIKQRISNTENSILERAVTGNIDNALTEFLRFMQGVDKSFAEEVGLSHSLLKNMSSIYYEGDKKRIKALKNMGVEINLPSGKSIRMTPAHRISFLLHNKNEHNYNSILKDGVKFDTNIDGKLNKLTVEDFDAIVKSATPSEKKIAKFFHNILNTKARDALLKTSKELQGYEMGLVEDYFPLHRRDLYRDFLLNGTGETGGIGENIVTSLENTSSLKGRQENARGTVIIEDAFKTFYDSIKLTAGYMAYAKPLRVSRRLVNDLKNEQASKYGIGRELDAIHRYLNDIEGNLAVRGDAFETIAKRVYGNAAQAVLGLNLTVVARQIPSYLTMGTTGVSAKNMLKGLGIVPGTEAYNEMLKKIEEFSPQTHQRITTGTVNAELGDKASQNEAARFFSQPKTLSEYGAKDVLEKQTFLIGAADKQVMVRIFNTAKAEIEEKNPDLTGDAKWEKIADRAEFIIRETQPMYSREHRSELGRSRNLLTRSFVSFTSVTNQLLNTYVTAAGRLRRNPGSKKAWVRFAQDVFWLNLSATIAMVGVDELRDKLFGKTATWGERGGRALKYFLAPLYFSGLATSTIQDLIRAIETGNFKNFLSRMAQGNLLTSILEGFTTGGLNISEGLYNKGWETGDWDKIIGGTNKIIDAAVKMFFGASYRNLINYGTKPFLAERGKPEVIQMSKNLDFRPFIPRTKNFGPMKYKIVKSVYDDYVKAVHRFVQDGVERTPQFEQMSDKRKVDFLKAQYRIAVRAEARFNMSDMVRIKESE